MHCFLVGVFSFCCFLLRLLFFVLFHKYYVISIKKMKNKHKVLFTQRNFMKFFFCIIVMDFLWYEVSGHTPCFIVLWLKWNINWTFFLVVVVSSHFLFCYSIVYWYPIYWWHRSSVREWTKKKSNVTHTKFSKPLDRK